jgi:hypothetical protein
MNRRTTFERKKMAIKNSAPATVDDVERMYQQKLASKDAENARAMYIMRKMGDLPAVYSADMSATSDQAALDMAEQAIRTQYQADMKIHAAKFPHPMDQAPRQVQEASAAAAAGKVETLDISKLSAYEKIRLGLQRQNAGK